MNKSSDTSFHNSNLAANYMRRPRLNKVLDQATCCQLVYVIAGTGYGKTQAVYHYIEQQQDSTAWWMQITDSDNISSRFWERLVHIISNDNPELAAKMRELGFPETLARFKQLIGIANGLPC